MNTNIFIKTYTQLHAKHTHKTYTYKSHKYISHIHLTHICTYNSVTLFFLKFRHKLLQLNIIYYVFQKKGNNFSKPTETYFHFFSVLGIYNTIKKYIFLIYI